MSHHLISQKLTEMVESCLMGNQLKVLEKYDTRVRGNWSINNRFMRKWLIVYIKDGNGWYHYDNQSIEMIPGRIFLISPSLLHSIEIDPENPPSFVSAHFRIATGTDDYFYANKLSPFLMYVDTKISDHLQYHFEQLVLPDHTTTVHDSILNHTHLLTIITNISKLSTTHQENINPVHPKVLAAKKLIDDHVYEPISIETIASDIGISRKYLSRLFKAAYQRTPKEYQIERRISFARELLMDNDITIKEVSDILGYKDAYTFSKQFKNICGDSPSTVRFSRD